MSSQRGAAMIETLIGLPVLCLLGLGALQIGLLMHARDALRHAVFEAARAGSVAHASRDAIETGLARGLAPLHAAGLQGAGPGAALARSSQALRAGLAGGWIRLRVLSPTRESFTDWGGPGSEASGGSPDVIEIPVDNLAAESLRRQPVSGSAGERASALVGLASGQTLADASLLRIELVYGVPASVPLVGPMLVWALGAMDGCSAPSGRRLGSVDLGRPERLGSGRGWICAFYGTFDAHAGVQSRVPVRTTALIRMQTPPRLDASIPRRVAR